MLETESSSYEETESFLTPSSRATKATKGRRKRSIVVFLLIALTCLTCIACLVFVKRRANEAAEEFHTQTVPREPKSLTGKESSKGINTTTSNALGNTKNELADNSVIKQHLKKQSPSTDDGIPQNFTLGEVTLPTISDGEPIERTSTTKIHAASQSLASVAPKTKIETKNMGVFGSDQYLRKADALIETAISAILAEYGQDPLDYNSNRTAPMFAWDKVDLAVEDQAPDNFRRRGKRENGGWTSPRSWKGLILRLVQALSTGNAFTVVLGGHSAAAGHGNHFHQSYMMQFHKVMAPVFKELGVELISRNMAQGGLGTVHSSMGSSSIYGDEIDLMLWDSGMTENHNPEHIDLFFRQALMSEGRVPVVWSAGGKFDLLRMYHNDADADVGEFGLGIGGIPETTSEQQAEELPWAVRHLKCSEERPDLCKQPYKYCATCWIPRKDGIKPIQKQNDPFKGQVKWHPGWRSHQLTGRVLAFSLLEALKDAIQMVRSRDSEVLDINMASYYDNIRSKVRQLDPSLGLCYRINTTLPGRMCRTPMKGRTQYTPRANPEITSVTSIIKPEPLENYVPKNNLKPLYEGPNAHNPCFDLPDGAVDVLARILGHSTSDRRSLEALNLARNYQRRYLGDGGNTTNSHSDETEVIVPGRGWQTFGEPQGYCDGTYNSICARSTRNRCVLSGHHDERGAVIGSEMAGWLVLEVPRHEVNEGIIVLKLHTWHEKHDNTRTQRWKTINNIPGNGSANDRSPGGRKLLERNGTTDSQMHPPKKRFLRHRQYETPELPTYFRFEYAIDGNITSLNRTEFLDRKQDIQRVVETLTLLDDSNFAANKNTRSSVIEVALRLRGCYNNLVFGVSHIYFG